ncbi:hypothetical protein FB567DRAFT_535448 [Paraphoma chrysanthemicola]|uniref:Zn(2)-C6 fungal-type domain-containing protein n=1 Tax=Paraphoma chrysanthemicola TaxID=798071 RepID=A0A8K0VU30_9PLEO|nr:hypothetical protein FB567DRAFT_535448 [Paraphoma chrysanthemicola]
MDDLEDELDLRYHRGLQPDVYYRCPTLESLDGALRNELEKNASGLIPVEVVTEFIFAAASTITIPVAQQPALDVLIEPAEHLQSMTVDYALCRDIDGKERLKIQRAIAKSIIEAIQGADGFKYSERSAQSKEGGDGARLKYVCKDSFQNRDRKNNMKKEQNQTGDDSGHIASKGSHSQLPTYDCGGALFIKFSIKREAINVVYKHNPIHNSPVNGQSNLPPLGIEPESKPRGRKPKAANGTKDRKRKRIQKTLIDEDNAYTNPDLDMSTSPEAPKSSAKKKSQKSVAPTSPDSSRKSSIKKSRKGKEHLSPSAARKDVQIRGSSPPAKLMRGKACVRCREKKIKCNEAKPACNQCLRGLWTCQYGIPGPKKRSKSGCINCKNRKRKCTEERPSCAHCLRMDDECAYGDYS